VKKENFVAQKKKDLPAFSFSHSSNVVKILNSLKCSIAISTYQAGKVILISPAQNNRLVTLPRAFQKPMGFALKGNQMILGCRDEIITFENSPQLAKTYPIKPNTYDSLFLPRVTFHTGRVDMHDLGFGDEGIWAVNTSFSCLCNLTGSHNFIPRWKPHFISKLTPEDRCHLNGLVITDGQPKFVTALGQTNREKEWKDNIIKGGILMDVPSNSVVLEGLAMPHSPTMYKGELYLLLSASGQFVKVNLGNGSYEEILNLGGFCRGLDFIGDFAFIGMSKPRKGSKTFSKLSLPEDGVAGVKIVHMPTKKLVADISYLSTVEEIYEVKILPNSVRPNILNTIDKKHKFSLSLPNETFWSRDQEK
jgi:uncharacterized protein (TIGR03032 family)